VNVTHARILHPAPSPILELSLLNHVCSVLRGRQSPAPIAHPEFVCREAAGQARMDEFRRTDFVLMIRLSRIGKKKKPFYRVVVIERTRPRNGRIKEAVGTYDPLKKPAEIKLDAERIKHWIGLGAQPSDTVRSFLRQQKIA